MRVSDTDRRILAAIEDGLPITPRPYLAVAQRLGLAEAEVIARLRTMLEGGVIKRLGLIVRHHELGYRANAMVVWDVPDGEIDDVAGLMAKLPFVTLCYRRERRPPAWPYNLFCMIHGRDRETVRRQIDQIKTELDLARVPSAVLFSSRRFKQRGARYGHVRTAEAVTT
jgi:DNA-binding Lrp family transcriptional regulator